MDNLDFVVIQLALERDGRMLRRVTSIDEVEGYNRAVDGIMARKAFDWNALEDRHIFTANKNVSFSSNVYIKPSENQYKYLDNFNFEKVVIHLMGDQDKDLITYILDIEKTSSQQIRKEGIQMKKSIIKYF